MRCVECRRHRGDLLRVSTLSASGLWPTPWARALYATPSRTECNVCYNADMSRRTSGRSGRTVGEDAADATLLASQALVGVAARSLAAIEDTLTFVQYRALVLLASRGVLNVGSLAEHLGVHAVDCNAAVRPSRREEPHRPQDVSRESARGGDRADERGTSSCTVGDRPPSPRNCEDRRQARPRNARGAHRRFLGFCRCSGESPDSAWKLGWTS